MTAAPNPSSPAAQPAGPAPVRPARPPGTVHSIWRRPTGKPSWPSINLSGIEHAGKSVEIARASASGMFGMTFVIAFGETTSDAYGAWPGANYQLTEPRTRRELYEAVRIAVREPRVDPAKPNLIAFDSASAYWELLRAEAQDEATARAAKKYASNPKDFDPTADWQITSDLWNVAKEHWYNVIGPLLAHGDGPVIFTTKLEYVSIFDAKGNITKQKEWKPVAHKLFGFDTDVTLQLRGRHERYLTSVKSLVYQMSERGEDKKSADYGVVDLLGQLGLSVETVGDKSRPDVLRDGVMPADWVSDRDFAVANDDLATIRRLWGQGVAVGAGPDVMDTLKVAGDEILANLAAAKQAAERELAALPAPEGDSGSTDGVKDSAAPSERAVLSEANEQTADDTPTDAPADGQTSRVADEDGRVTERSLNVHVEDSPERGTGPVRSDPALAEKARWRKRFEHAVFQGDLRVVTGQRGVAESNGWSDLVADADRVIDEMREEGLTDDSE